eukprot:767567-Hanusia_phi.AAC.2
MPSREEGRTSVTEETRTGAGGEAGGGSAGGAQVSEGQKYAGGWRFLNDVVKGTVKVKTREKDEEREGKGRESDGG